MKTYQDLLLIPDNEELRMKFVRDVINEHKATKLYETAFIADKYFRHKNVTINQYQKLLYTVSGKAIPDIWSANFKMASRHYFRFIVQEIQYLLGNGVSFENEETENKLGKDDKSFDNQIQKLATEALNGGVAFGFFDYDHIEDFSVLEFAPLYDELNGSLKAGARFWQIDDNKPLRATLYEIDGYTDYLWITDQNSAVNITDDWIKISSLMYYRPKKPYILKINKSAVDGEKIVDGENYPDFPIVPLWANPEKQSEFTGLRETIDCIDLVRSGYANDVDDASIIYWTLQNAGGMNDVDLAQFVERMKTVKAVALDDEVQAESHTLDVPYASREALLSRLEKDLYKDAMALDVEQIASGNVTATQIKAAYDPLNEKTDRFEFCVTQFIDKILSLAGIDDNPTYTRSKIANTSEEITTVIQSSGVLPSDYVVEKIVTLLGDKDRVPEVIKSLQADSIPIVENE